MSHVGLWKNSSDPNPIRGLTPPILLRLTLNRWRMSAQRVESPTPAQYQRPRSRHANATTTRAATSMTRTNKFEESMCFAKRHIAPAAPVWPRLLTHTHERNLGRGHGGTGVASFFAGPLSCENAATAILVPIVKLDVVGLCRALDLIGLCHKVGLRRGSFKSKLAVSPA